jgi:hypothetical protein
VERASTLRASAASSFGWRARMSATMPDTPAAASELPVAKS